MNPDGEPVEQIDEDFRAAVAALAPGGTSSPGVGPVSYTHLTLPTNREV